MEGSATDFIIIDLTATEIKQVQELVKLQEKIGIDSPL